MPDFTFETIEVTQGSFFSWGPRPGQKITGRVVDYSPNGGTDFNDEPCPQLVLELTSDAYSITKDGEQTDFARGDFVTLNTGQANLKKLVRSADPAAGDVVEISFAKTERSPRGTVKIFDMKIARGAAKDLPKPASRPADDDPPF
jgi:hypothetical protein